MIINKKHKVIVAIRCGPFISSYKKRKIKKKLFPKASVKRKEAPYIIVYL